MHDKPFAHIESLVFVARLSSEVQSLKTKLASTQSELQSLHRTQNDATKNQEETIAQLRLTLLQRDASISRLTDSIDSASTDKAAMQVELARVQSEAARAISTLETSLRDSTAKCSELERLHTSAEVAHIEAIRRLQAQCETTELANKGLQEDLDLLTEEHQTTVQALKEEIVTITSANADLIAQVAALEALEQERTVDPNIELVRDHFCIVNYHCQLLMS